MPPGFLNSREDAILVWFLLILAFVLWKDFAGIARSLLGVIRAVLEPKLVTLFGAALVYSLMVVSGASRVGLWDTGALKVTIYWYVGTAVVLAGRAVSQGNRSSGELLRGILRRVFVITALIEFAVNVYALPLAVELVGVGVVLLFTGMQAEAEYEHPSTAPVRKVINGVLIAVGLLYIANFAIQFLSDPASLTTWENAEELYVPPTLTLGLVPFLLGAAWYARREQERLQARFRTT